MTPGIALRVARAACRRCLPVLLLGACTTAGGQGVAEVGAPGPSGGAPAPGGSGEPAPGVHTGVAAAARPVHESLVGPPLRGPGVEFQATWFDGTAELTGYRITVPRYGALREGELVLITVTEPMDRRTRIKDDGVEPPDRVEVLKLNASLRFLTGIYPYSVMTTVLSPIGFWDEVERFAPVKVTTSVQEWCGHVFHGMWPGDASYAEELVSYFASEGDTTRRVEVPAGTLYEDALWIQLRELDGPFNGGADWSGSMVPSQWSLRQAHVLSGPEPARITRSRAERDGVAVHRFVVETARATRTLDVEVAAPRRALGWTSTTGEVATMIGSARLPYWQLNGLEGEAARARLGLAPDLSLPAATP